MTKRRKLGLIPDLPDPRDHRLIGIVRAADDPLPRKVDLRPRLPKTARNQGQEGACTGFACAGDIFAALAYSGERAPDNDGPSEAFLYYNARRLHGTTDEDSGASIRNVVKAAVKWGFVPNSVFPYKAGDYKKKPSEAVYKRAEKGRIVAYERVTGPDGAPRSAILDLVLKLLAQGDPVLTGFSVSENFDEAGKTGRMPKPAGSVRGGHAVLFVGYDMKRQVLITRNSWGPRWGKDGHFDVPFSVFTAPGVFFDLWTIKTADNL